MSKYFPDVIAAYVAQDHIILPLPEKSKASPPGGYTGHHGEIPDADTYKRWAKSFPKGNVAFRPADGLIGFDIDTYTHGDKVKDGHQEWRDLCARHGSPPPTVTSTARDPEVSGIRWYKVPKGLKWPGKIGEAIEVVQHVHRYAVVWPSVHPELETTYKWYNADGGEMSVPPRDGHFAELPEEWVRAITSGQVYEKPNTLDVSLDEVDSWIEERPQGEPCREMLAQLDRTLGKLSGDGGAYETTLAGVWALVNLSIDGHNGILAALTDLAQAYGNEISTRGDDQRDAASEWQRMISGAVSKLATRETSPHCWCSWSLKQSVEVKSDSEDEAPNEFILPNGRKMRVTRMSDIKMKRTRWLWDERIAMGTLSLVAGQPSMGKSTFVYWLVAALTNGRLFGEFEGKAKDVVLCCTEDDYSATIKPRLAAAGADLTRILRMELTTANDIADGLNLVEDLVGLEILAEHYDLGLLVLDPLMSRLGGKDSHKDAEVREALEPLTALAMKCAFSIIGLIHFNKSGGSDPVNLIMGSAAFVAVARSVHIVMQDPEDDSKQRRLLGTTKNNLGRISGDSPHDLKTYAFHIESATMTSEAPEDEGAMLTTSKLVWEDNSDLSVQDAIVAVQAKTRSDGKPKKETKQDKAAAWLTALFKKHDRPLTRSEVLDAAGKDKLSSHSEQNLGLAMRNRDEFEITREYQKDKGVISYWGLAGSFD